MKYYYVNFINLNTGDFGAQIVPQESQEFDLYDAHSMIKFTNKGCDPMITGWREVTEAQCAQFQKYLQSRISTKNKTKMHVINGGRLEH